MALCGCVAFLLTPYTETHSFVVSYPTPRSYVMENFSIEFNHTDAEIPAYAARCGCSKCERYRRQIDAQLDRAAQRSAEIVAAQPAPRAAVNVGGGIVGDVTERVIAASNASQERSAHIGAVLSQPLPQPTTTATAQHIPSARVAYCECPIGTRPNAAPGAQCPACNRPRRARGSYGQATSGVTGNEHNRQMGAAIGVQTDLRSPTGTGNAETRSPRQIALDEIDARLSASRAPTRQDLQKWSTLLRSSTVEIGAQGDGLIKASEVVLGARQSASGIILGWTGAGNLTRSQIAAVLEAAKLPADWLPAAKSAHAQLGRVVGALSGNGYVVRAARVPAGRRSTTQNTREARDWKARYSVGAARMDANVGEAFGRTVLTVTLTATDTIVIEGEEHLAARVRADFDTACATDLYPVTDVGSWLKGTLAHRFRAAHFGQNWYVRSRYAADAERLCFEMSKIWGAGWLPCEPGKAVPMSTCEQLCRGLLDNFAAEADAVLKAYRDELAEAKAEAAKHGEECNEIGTRRATTLLGEIRTLAERAVCYAGMFGDRMTLELREKLCAAADEIAESIDDISQRFSLIFDELRRDARRDGWDTL